MKFLCPSCKAKYQIADEKVAGRSVRMKCRKCGFVIPLSEIPPAPETKPPDDAEWDVPPPVVPKAPPAPSVSLTGAPASPAPAPVAEKSKPAAPAAPLAPAPAAAAKAPAPATTSRAAPVPKPAPKAPSAPGAPASSVAAKPNVARPAAAAPAPRAAASPASTTKGPVPKASPGAVASKAAPSPAPAVASAPAARTATPAPAITSGAAARTATPAPALAGRTATPSPASATTAPASAEAAPATAPAAPVSAAAVSAPVPSAAPVASVDLLPAIGDGGEDDDDATRIVKGGALADAFGALVGSPSGPPPSDLGMPADEWFVGINDVPVGPIRLGEIRKRALLGAITLDSMVWRDGLEAWRPLKTFPELVAVLEESMSSVRASSAPLVRPAAGSPPFAKAGEPDSLAGASSGITGAAVVTDDYAAAGLSPGRSPIVAWLAIVVALGCGLTIGFVVWSKQKPPETIVKYVQVPAPTQATPAAAAAAEQQATTAEPAATGAAPKAHGGSKSSGVARTPDTGADKGGGLSGLKGLSALGPAGPGVSNTSPGSAPAGGGGQLDGAQTQATVSRYTGSVKRSCWQPALDARAPDAPTSARVTVTITVGGTGSVQNVTTSGDPRGYPGLANCIGGRVRAWQFPATGGSTTVNVPFVFAAQ